VITLEPVPRLAASSVTAEVDGSQCHPIVHVLVEMNQRILGRAGLSSGSRAVVTKRLFLSTWLDGKEGLESNVASTLVQTKVLVC